MLGLSSAIFVGLFLASIVIFFQDHNNPDSETKKNKRRILTWWIIFGICLPVCFYGGWLAYLFMCGLFALALLELIRLSLITKAGWLYFVISLLGFFLLSIFNVMPALLYALAFILFFITWVIKANPRAQFIIVAAYACVCLQSLLYVIEFSGESRLDSGLVLLSLLFISSVNDIAQYVIGRKFGCYKLAPSISPNKTVEGALGGLMVTMAIGIVLLPEVLMINWPLAAIIGLFLSVLGIAGDLYFSNIKRSAGVKDAGNLLPGHGGVLDRIDSVLLMGPGFGLVLLYLIGQ